jgi:hypothetical protein
MEQEATPQPISPQNVVSKRESPAAPDSSILQNRLDSLFQSAEPQQPQEQTEYVPLHVVKNLLGEHFGQVPQQKKQESNAQYEERIREMAERMDQMQQSYEDLSSKMRQTAEETAFQEASKDVSRWVDTNADHYPITTKLGYSSLVFQKIYNTRQATGRTISAAQAASEVEQEFTKLIERGAEILGYRKSEPTAVRNEEVSPTTEGLAFTEPVDRDRMTDHEWLQYLIAQQQRQG